MKTTSEYNQRCEIECDCYTVVIWQDIKTVVYMRLLKNTITKYDKLSSIFTDLLANSELFDEHHCWGSFFLDYHILNYDNADNTFIKMKSLVEKLKNKAIKILKEQTKGE